MNLMITWDALNERQYQYGLDRGVLYIPGKPPTPWNGLLSVDEGSAPGDTEVMYRDGVPYLADVDASDFSAKITAMFYPDEFSECLGMPQMIDGFYIDNQKPKRFNLSYRTLIGSGGTDDPFGYQIHLIYNAVPSIGSRSRRTMGSEIETTDFTFDLACTPVRVGGFRPSSHFVIDTRTMDADQVRAMEGALYAKTEQEWPIPTVAELIMIINRPDVVTPFVERFL